MIQNTHSIANLCSWLVDMFTACSDISTALPFIVFSPRSEKRSTPYASCGLDYALYYRSDHSMTVLHAVVDAVPNPYFYSVSRFTKPRRLYSSNAPVEVRVFLSAALPLLLRILWRTTCFIVFSASIFSSVASSVKQCHRRGAGGGFTSYIPT